MTGPGVRPDMDVYLSGRELYGNDFSQEEINAWFSDEAEGYYNLVEAQAQAYSYGYHSLNARHGFSRLPRQRFKHVLGVGSAYGDELAPVLERSDRISILEPSEGFKQDSIRNVPVTYVRPNSTGVLPFSDRNFDLITCFGVLHHIPNVGKVIDEYFRVLQPGGHVLLREPVTSMGDWRSPRRGLTKRERGIPLEMLRDMVSRAGFEVVRERKCMFSLTSRLRYVMSRPVFNNPLVVALDEFASALPVWSRVYHARSFWQKIRPSAVFFVLHKPR